MSEPDKPPAEKFADEILSVCLRWWEESDLDVDDIYNYGEFSVRSFCEAQDPSFKVTEEITEGIVLEFEPDEEEEEE